MDYLKALNELTTEKARLDEAIRALELISAAQHWNQPRQGQITLAKRARSYEKIRTFWENHWHDPKS